MKLILLILSLFAFVGCAHKHDANHSHSAKKDHKCNCSKAAENVKPVAFEFDGACPMGLCRKGQKVKCDPEITLAHQGKSYCFSTLEARDTFMKDLKGNLAKANNRWKRIQAAGSR